MDDLYKEIYMQDKKKEKSSKRVIYQTNKTGNQYKKRRTMRGGGDKNPKLRYPVQVSLFLNGLCATFQINKKLTEG